MSQDEGQQFWAENRNEGQKVSLNRDTNKKENNKYVIPFSNQIRLLFTL